MNANATIILDDRGTTRAGYVVSAHVPFGEDESGRRRYADYTIDIDAGGTPRVTVHAWHLTLDETRELRRRIDETILALRVMCRCGLPFSAHAHESPHGAALGDCRSFTAASPIAEDAAR